MVTKNLQDRIYDIIKNAEKPLSAREISKRLPRRYASPANVGHLLKQVREAHPDVLMFNTTGHNNVYTITRPNNTVRI